MRVRVVAGVVGVVLSVSALGACADPVSPAPGGLAPTQPMRLVAGDPFDVALVDLVPLGLPRTPVDINERGQMVGACMDRALRSGVREDAQLAPGVAFLWSREDGLRELGTLGGAASCAAALNDRGDVVGYSLTSEGTTRAFRWTPDGGLRDLGTLPGGANSRALNVNNAGLVVGWSEEAGGARRAVRWTADGVIESLGNLPDRLQYGEQFLWVGGGASQATAINELGQVVGWERPAVAVPGPSQRPFLWTAASGKRHLTTGGKFDDDEVSIGFGEYPYDINDRGLIVGTRGQSTGALVGVLRDTTGARLGFSNTTREPSLRCNPASAFAADRVVYTRINETGQVSGYCLGSMLPAEGFVIVDGFGARDLPLPPGTSDDPIRHPPAFAYGLNEAGDIVGEIRGSAALWTVRAKPGEALLVDGNSGRCLDVLGESREPGAGLIVYDCHGGANQRFSYPAAGQTGEIRVYAGEGTPLCVDAWGAGTENGTRLVVWTCHGGANQQWTRTADGEFRGVQSGRCVDVLGARTENLTDVWLWDCFGGAPNQRWDARAPAGGATLAAAPLARPTLARR